MESKDGDGNGGGRRAAENGGERKDLCSEETGWTGEKEMDTRVKRRNLRKGELFIPKRTTISLGLRRRRRVESLEKAAAREFTGCRILAPKFPR
ncbi:hypothetical protein ACJRO7_005166 [Eucalyptus globulus]|uniref:Uncharacterized protein n=1 Tax=Eucalyptus globulus TaxID=34317 RepID=A0ABD3J2F4_EUCGL